MAKADKILFSSALRQTIKKYDVSTFRHDFLAAFVVSLVALPLSMALSIAVGLPPQHGIYTAIIAGIVVPLLGGSVWQVSGPTAAFIVILAPIVSQLGLRGIIWAGVLAGIILIIMGFARIGRLINYVPYPVTTGFTSGIAVVLFTLSMNDFLGLGIEKMGDGFMEKAHSIFSHISAFDPYTFMVGVVTLVLLFTATHLIRFMPSAIVAILAGAVLSAVFSTMGHEVATIGSVFSYHAPDGSVIAGVPPNPPILHLPTFAKDSLFTIPTLEEFRHLLFPALAIAILAALESLLSATVADGMTGTKHNPNAELNALGIGNILSAFAAGIPATGAIARTATIINNGGKTPIASCLHGVFIMIHVLLLAQIISYMPMASLSALLIHTAYRMSHYKQFVRILQIAPRGDIIVLLTCFILTVFVDMVAGIGVGMICAAFMLIQRVTELTAVEIEKKGAESSTASYRVPSTTMIYRIRGPLFFGTIEKAFDRSKVTYDSIKNFIVDISEVPFIDMTGLVAIKSMLSSIANEDRTVHIVCKSPQVRQKIRQKIREGKIGKFVHFHESIQIALKS